jgi:dihydroxyacetone kinase-like predicted kinase
MLKYYLEFTLNTYNVQLEIIKSSLMEFGDNLEVYQLPKDDKEKGENFRINIYTEDPTIIFDTCAQFGRLKSVKVSEATTYGT